MIRFSLPLALLAAAGTTAAIAAPSLSDMKDQRRVLLVAAPAAQNAQLVAQRRAFAAWKQEAADRDVSLVAVVGGTVEGAGDGAAALRKRYDLPAGGFMALLIGKDGHVAMRSAQPISAETLQGTIDAMPMRRAGQR